MLRLEDEKWKEFTISQLFETEKGNQNKMNELIKGNVPLISAKKFNNGCKCFVEQNSKKLFNGKCLTINNDGDGGAGLTFYQPNIQFALDSHCTALYPNNDKLNEAIMKFVSCCMDIQSEYYGHSHSLSNNRMNTYKYMLPVTETGDPDYEFMEQYIKEHEKKLLDEYIEFAKKKLSEMTYKAIKSLEECEWKEFRIEDICDIQSGCALTKKEMKEGCIPFIGASANNNAVTEFVVNENKSIDENVLSVNFNGSVGESFYHPYKALFSGDVKRLHVKNGDNMYVDLFIATAIKDQKEKYSYGYKFSEQRMKRQYILLPISLAGEPDYEYMEQYVKNIMIEKLTEYLKFVE